MNTIHDMQSTEMGESFCFKHLRSLVSGPMYSMTLEHSWTLLWWCCFVQLVLWLKVHSLTLETEVWPKIIMPRSIFLMSWADDGDGLVCHFVTLVYNFGHMIRGSFGLGKKVITATVQRWPPHSFSGCPFLVYDFGDFYMGFCIHFPDHETFRYQKIYLMIIIM